jgi:hypothetical protein
MVIHDYVLLGTLIAITLIMGSALIIVIGTYFDDKRKKQYDDTKEKFYCNRLFII